MSSDRGLHAAADQKVSADAYDRYIGRWSRLFVPSLLTAAEVGAGDQVLDVATGTGEAAIAAIPLVGDTGVVVGADISAAMLGTARARLPRSYRAIVTDGQALAFQDASFDAVLCQLGLMFFPDPARRPQTERQCGVPSPMRLADNFPSSAMHSSSPSHWGMLGGWSRCSSPQVFAMSGSSEKRGPGSSDRLTSTGRQSRRAEDSSP